MTIDKIGDEYDVVGTKDDQASLWRAVMLVAQATLALNRGVLQMRKEIIAKGIMGQGDMMESLDYIEKTSSKLNEAVTGLVVLRRKETS